MKHSANGETGTEPSSLGFTRNDVLALLWKNAEWLNDKIHKQRIKLNGRLRQRVYMVQVQSGVCKTLLSGMKDTELDEIIKEIEKIKQRVGLKT